MKNEIYFKEVNIVSIRDKKGFSFEFSPTINFIHGDNDTGKSSLIKSLYYTLGGDLRLDDLWKNDDIVTRVVLSFNNADIVFLRHNKMIGVFDDEMSVYFSIADLAGKVSDIFGFNLQLHNKYKGVTEQANPACYYLPFYIDQDEGWHTILNSFSGLGMYSEWQRNILYYHSGVKPKEYYLLQGEIKRVRAEISDLEAIVKVIKVSKGKIDDSFGIVLFDVDVTFYESKLDALMTECRELEKAEADFRFQLLSLYSQRNRISDEIECSNRLLHENFTLWQDAMSSENIVNEYGNLAYQNELTTHLPKLYESKEMLDKKIQKLRFSLCEKKESSERIKSLLAEVKGELTLKDIIRSVAYHEIFETFQNQLDALLKDIGEKTISLNEYLDEQKIYDDKKRTAQINDGFKGHLQHALKELGVGGTNGLGIASYSKITKGKTGSRNPRGIFAYHYALLKVLSANESVDVLPIVIDSPKQQDLDRVHTEKLIEICVNDLSTLGQVIIGTVKLENNMHGYHSLFLDCKYSLLSEKNFDEAYGKIMPLFSQMLLR